MSRITTEQGPDSLNCFSKGWKASGILFLWILPWLLGAHLLSLVFCHPRLKLKQQELRSKTEMENAHADIPL
jgi:hypothetical protein